MSDTKGIRRRRKLIVGTKKQNNEKLHNAISEVGKGDCIIMGDFNYGNIKWDTLQSTGVEDQTLLCLVQDNFLTQHVLEPTRAARILNIVLSSQKEFVDNVVIQEPLGSSDHNQLHFNIKIKSVKTKVKQCRRDFRKGNYKEIRKRLAHIDGNDKMKNKTATECWNILRVEVDSAIDSFVPTKKQGRRAKKNHLSKDVLTYVMLGQRYTTPMVTVVCPVTNLHHLASLQTASSFNCTSYAGIVSLMYNNTPPPLLPILSFLNIT